MWSLYQSLEESSPMRFHVYYTLVQLAGKTEQVSNVFKEYKLLFEYLFKDIRRCFVVIQIVFNKN